MPTTRHWADDPYWSEALNRYVDQRRRGRKITIDLERLESFIYNGDSPAYRLMDAMCSVKEQESEDGYRGAPRLALALLQILGEAMGSSSSRTRDS
jgi:hypothetical protein